MEECEVLVKKMKLGSVFRKLHIFFLCFAFAILGVCPTSNLETSGNFRQEASDHANVGVLYYVYYNKPWNKSQIVDIPLLGFYNSCDPEVCRNQVFLMDGIGLDFAIISWFGANTRNPIFEFRNNAAKVMFEAAKNYSKKLHLAIMVEPFNETFGGYNYKQIYDYIYENFVLQYPTVYFQYRDKPLICFYCNEASYYLMQNNTYPRDSRFSVVNLGTLSYAEWLYESYSPFWHGDAPRCRHWAIMPRFDETHIPKKANYSRRI